MKLWSSVHTFHHPWEVVAQAVYRKYPNPMNTAVLGVDIIDRKVVDGKLYSHRLVSSIWGFPKWAQRLIGTASVCYGSEWSEVDPGNKKFTLVTRNLTFYNYIDVIETLKYAPHPTDPNKTELVQEAVVTVQGVPLANYMEDLLTTKISVNASKGREAMEWVISNVKSEMKEFADNAVKSTDELLTHTRRQFDDLTTKTKRGMDDIQTVARKSFGEIHNLASNPSSESMPKI